MLKKSASVVLATVFVLALFCVSFSVVFGQYETQRTSYVTIASNGVSHVSKTLTVGGISLDIAGTPGATGAVTTATYNGNPEAGAQIPANTKLTNFVVVTFDFEPSEFQGAAITISYTDAQVAGMVKPFDLYKYNPQTDSYVKLNAVFDASAKTLTTTVLDITDPLFAIGGTPGNEESDSPVSITFIIGVVVLVAVSVFVVAVLLLRRRKPTFQLIE